MREIIITCALTGSIHTPSMSPHLPVTADEIVQAGVEAAEAGHPPTPRISAPSCHASSRAAMRCSTSRPAAAR